MARTIRAPRGTQLTCKNWLIEAAYRFCLSEPGLHSVLMGTGDIDHLRQNLAAATAGPLADRNTLAPAVAKRSTTRDLHPVGSASASEPSG